MGIYGTKRAVVVPKRSDLVRAVHYQDYSYSLWLLNDGVFEKAQNHFLLVHRHVIGRCSLSGLVSLGIRLYYYY